MKIKKYTLILIAILLAASFLRLWRITEVPVSLFGDELDVGYHALSILKTGRDYQGNFLPLHFHSLAEWRTPLYLYSVVPTVALFGISPLGVRLPAAIFGLLSIWGMYLLTRQLLSGRVKTRNRAEAVALVAAAILAFSPWHIQYSRAAFEVTQLLALLIFGLYFFFQSLKNGKLLWVSATLLALTPWVYSTAKLFTPLLLIFLLIVWRKEIFALSKKYLVWAIFTLFIVGGPIAFSTLFGGGTQRFGYVSVFTDPTVVSEVGTARLQDARFRGELGGSLAPDSQDRFYHNKGSFWIENIVNNYLQALSSDFLFIKGDLNLRHSIDHVGQFYWIEAVALLLGLVLFFGKFKDRKIKLLIAFWILAGIVPSAITRDGGNHATRLILMLPPLVFLIAYGLVEGLYLIKRQKVRIAVLVLYLAILIMEFVFYQHTYWVHNPWESELWWHSGFKQSFEKIKSIEKDYDRVFISMAGEPAWIFFAGWSEYPPEKWQEEFPIGNDEFVEGFGNVSHSGKYYFGTPASEEGGVFSLNRYLGERELYLAVAKEIGENLILEPGKKPNGLKLIEAIPYPSGEPAYYLFERE